MLLTPRRRLSSVHRRPCICIFLPLPSMLITLLFTIIFAMPACSTGAPYSKAHLKDHRTRRPTGHAAKEHMNLIQKRFDNTRFTYFYPGQNACGGFDNNESMVSSLASS